MILSNFQEEERRQLAALFVSPGWALLKAEYDLRKKNLITDLVYGHDREKDADRRALIVAIDSLLKVERELFAPAPPPEMVEQPFTLPQPSVNRY